MKIVSADATRMAAVAAMAAVLAGCGSAMTYGTGTSPAVQTVEDIAGIVSFGGKRKEPIDYSPRPPIVAPPTTEVLPPPGSAQGEAVAANWPKDPDEARRKLKKQQAEAELYGGPPSPTSSSKALKFSLPAREGVEYPQPGTVTKKLSNKEIKKMFADARGNKGGSYDAEGKPIRKYLTEPPPSYREPDPNSPVEITDKPKKKKKFSLKNLWPF